MGISLVDFLNGCQGFCYIDIILCGFDDDEEIERIYDFSGGLSEKERDRLSCYEVDEWEIANDDNHKMCMFLMVSE